MTCERNPRPDVFLLPVTLAGDELAHFVHAGKEAVGHRVVDTFELIGGTLVRKLEIYGKRPGEGIIAQSVKARKFKEGD